MNKKNLLIAFCAAILVLSTGTANADILTEGAGWTVYDSTTLSNSYTVSSSGSVHITITDLFVATDNYNVFLNGSLIASTASGSDFDFNSDPDSANADSSFVHIGFTATNGDVIDIFGTPPPGFADTTWAIRADSVPEPGTMILLGSGLAGFIARRRMLNN